MRRNAILPCAAVLALVACKKGDGDDSGAFYVPEDDWDGDGFLAVEDCNDYDALVSPAGVEHCQNGLDDDCNGTVDCFDAACDGSALCIPPEDCDDGFDNDEDTLTDCADDDCFLAWPCQDCMGFAQVTCGFYGSGDVSSGSQGVTSYSCGAEAPNQEFVYDFIPSANGTLTITVDPADDFTMIKGLDAAIFVMEEACREDTCVGWTNLAASGGVETLSVPVLAGMHYYVAIESVVALTMLSNATYDILFACE